MKHLKQFKIFENKQTDEEIHALCKQYDIKNYTINLDKSIDVDGDAILYSLYLDKLPLKFRNVSGNFNCSGNNLTALEGAPETVGGHFACAINKLTTLEGAPKTADGHFNCGDNNLTTLEGAPETVRGNFKCDNNKLTTLEGAPETVGGNFTCSFNKNLMSLEGISATLRGVLFCGYTPIEYFWKEFLNKDENLLFSFVEDWDVIREDLVVIGLLEAYMEENNIKTEIDIKKIKSLGYRIE